MSEELFNKLSNILSSSDAIESNKDGKVTKEECNHLYILTDGKNEICQICGSEKQNPLSLEKEWRYFGDSSKKDPSRCNLRKSNTKLPLTSQCEKVNIKSGKVVNDANQYYLDVTKGKIYRGKKRISIIYACVYYSLKANNSSYSPDKLLQIFEIDRTTALRGLKFVKTNLSQKENQLLMVKTNQPCLDENTNETEIEKLLKEIMEDLNATESQIQEIKLIYKYLCGKSSLLNRSRPQSFATGLVKYYILKRNPSFVFEIKYNVKLSNLTLKRIMNEIETIMN